MSRRRAPVQDRSRATVERILDAAGRLLADGGYAAASTNAVAREAGVSPGTLYQYFSDRDEIVEELVRRMIADFEAALGPVLRGIGTMDSVTSSRALIEAVLGALGRNADLLRAVVDRIPATGQADQLRSVRSRLTDAIHHLRLRDHPEETPAETAAVAWFVLETAQHLTVRYVLDRPPIAHEDFISKLSTVLGSLD